MELGKTLYMIGIEDNTKFLGCARNLKLDMRTRRYRLLKGGQVLAESGPKFGPKLGALKA